MTPYDWMTIRASGQMPPPSAVGPSSPYWRILPAPSMVGQSSLLPQSPALTRGGPGALGRSMIRRPVRALPAGARALPAGALPTSGRAALPAAARVFPMGPASTPGAGAAGAATATTAARAAAPVMGPGMVGVPMVPVGQAAGSAAANTGMMGALRNAASSTAGRVAAGGLRGALPGLGIALGGVQAGAALDQSNLLGGEDSKLNDSVSKMAKYGAAGAGGGLIVGGPVGALVGGVGGGVVGLIHEGLERQGILGTPSRTEQIDNFITEADNAAAQIGLPPEVTEALKTQYNAELMFADSKAEQLDLAQRYAQAMEEQVVAFATNPEQFQTAEQNDEAAMVSDFIRRSALINAIQPYANQMQAVSNATADSFENMAAGAGDLAPMYQAFADLQRQSGTRHAAGMMQDARMTPYMAALEQQASYLNQISQQTMQQAISGVMNPQTAAGSTDLTAIIDQATSQLQPN